MPCVTGPMRASAPTRSCRSGIRLLTGIPGIAAASAIQLMGEPLVLPEDMRASTVALPDWIRARAPGHQREQPRA